MYSVFQHWDPLKVCVVGRSYPPEFYSWIQDSNTRQRFEQLAEETEQDYQALVNLLQSKFGIRVLRPQLSEDSSRLKCHGRWIAPPVAPRDFFVMIHNQLWIPRIPNHVYAKRAFANQSDLDLTTFQTHDLDQHRAKLACYQNIFQDVADQGNQLQYTDLDVISGCFVSRIGQDLYFATQSYDEDQRRLLDQVNQQFPNTRNRIVNAGGHGDSTYCPVTPGLIISLRDVPTYANTFPGWEVVYLPPSTYADTNEFRSSMRLNRGRWNIPGFESNPNLVHMVDHYFDSWVGNASETVFDVNILVIDQKNIIVTSHNDQVEESCARHGIEVHVVPFRHRYFWDAGVHCITNDLSREGKINNYFADTDK
jgi:hypothetical protein